ncbi:CPBP family intramembrane glutamic endopeptidase [Paenibacillus caui]|uniref:CPBP family intramembrane glutamic endopeptidase n=1 Tax=Paenibacillus caui TaxID=2873927 RepID=UPI001CA9B126|nr:CPBP family intramembrane glutamic endopeptidase [Paenibacillus caui]
MKQNNDSIHRFFKKPVPIKLRTIIASAIMPLIFGLGMILIVIVLLLNISPESTTATALPSKEKFIPWFFVFKLVSVVLIAPICEEIIFRGYLLGRLTDKFGLKKGIIFSSVIFGVLHLQNIFGATMMGIILCLIFIKTNSLVTPIIVHITSNAIVGLRDIYLAFDVGTQNVQSTSAPSLPLILIGALILTIIGSIWLVPFLKRNWKKLTDKGYPLIL